MRETELSLIALCLDNSTACLVHAEDVRGDMFSDDGLGLAWSIIRKGHASGEPLDTIALHDALTKEGRQDATKIVGDIAACNAWELHLVPQRAAAIMDRWARESISKGLTEVVMMTADKTKTIREIRTCAEEAVFALRSHDHAAPTISMERAVNEVLERVEAAQRLAEEGKTLGVPSGFDDIDRVTLGWQPTDFIVVAARPSVGKSAFAGELIMNAGCPALVFSLEMSAMQLAERIVLPEAGIDKYRALTGRMSDEDWQNLASVAGKVGSLPIFIDERGGLDIEEVRSVARRHVSKHGVGIIVVDYLQLATAMVGKNGNREQQISSISRGMKNMAKELNVPVIALSQLNRIHYTERPDLSNLRESGAIEQDADVVAFLWREEDLPNGEKSPILNLAIDKNRHGPLTSTQVTYKRDSARIVPYTPDYDNTPLF